MTARPIELSSAPVKVRGEALDEIWWRGKQWAVTSYGIECLDGTYFFTADRLLEDLPSGRSWAEHMAEKIWVDVDEFVTAWLVALVLHGHEQRKMIRESVVRALKMACAR